MNPENKPEGEPDARQVYADIFSLPRWEPDSSHPRMSLHDRAAQFAPFAALTGYDDMVEEEARLTDSQIEPGEDQLKELDRKLSTISRLLAAGTRPEAAVTFFVPDDRKAGGRYATVNMRIKKIDLAARKLVPLPDGQEDLPESIELDRILSLTGAQIDSPDIPD